MRACFLIFIFLIPGCSWRTATKGKTDVQNISTFLDSVRSEHGMPAIAAAVVLDGRLAALGVAGERKLGSGVAVTSSDQFHLGSCTKAMTASMIARLVQKKKLDWSTNLKDTFPDFVGVMHPDYHEVTLYDLLTHRAGLHSADKNAPAGKTLHEMHLLPGTGKEQRETYVRLMLFEPPHVTPRTQEAYSNVGYSVAAAIAERQTGSDWSTLMRKYLFKPLGMKTVGNGAMGEPGEIRQPWQHEVKGHKVHPVEPGRFANNPRVMFPGGGVHCSMEDWCKFVTLHFTGKHKGRRLLKKKTLKKLHQPASGKDSYACGWYTSTRGWGGEVLAHAGSNLRNFAVVWMSPEKKFAVMVATNQGRGKSEQICDQVCGELIRRFLLE
jgi:CubicO group peptidase (beta-lactamase class C family)